MWPVRSRRGTCKRCLALFVVGVCAAIMILSRPFINTSSQAPPAAATGQQLAPLLQPPAALNGTSIHLQQQLHNNNNNNNNNNNSSAPVAANNNINQAQPPPISSTSEKNQPPPQPPAPVSMAIKPEYIQEQPNTDEEGASEVNEDPYASTSTSTASQPLTSGPIAVAPTTSKGGEPVVYVLTPTFPRMEQMAELTRLGQTLMLIPHLHWLVVDDAAKKSPEVEALLKRTKIPYTYLVAQMPDKYRKKKTGKPKGVANRLAGLKWLKEHAQDNGVMFFADDDNSYDIRLFEEMRWTKKVSMWPVGLVTQLGVSTPVVKDGRVIDFYDGWISTRKFPVDMAGFAVNIKFLKSAINVTMPFKAGYEEDGFLRSLNITINDIEPKADNCTKVYVWHTKTVGNKVPQKISAKDRKRFNSTNLFSLPHIV